MALSLKQSLSTPDFAETQLEGVYRQVAFGARGGLGGESDIVLNALGSW